MYNLQVKVYAGGGMPFFGAILVLALFCLGKEENFI
jgi:hypothetical protein